MSWNRWNVNVPILGEAVHLQSYYTIKIIEIFLTDLIYVPRFLLLWFLGSLMRGESHRKVEAPIPTKLYHPKYGQTLSNLLEVVLIID